MSTRTVIGTCFHFDGTPWTGGIITFSLLEPFEISNGFYPKETHSLTLDANGAFSIALGVPDTGTAAYMIETPDHDMYKVHIAAGAPTTLQTLLTVAGSSVAQSDLQTLLDQYSVLAITNKTATYNIEDTDEVVRCDGTFTVTLPAATGSGAVYIVKNIGTGTITLAAQSGETIDGDASVAIVPTDWYTVIDAAPAVWNVI